MSQISETPAGKAGVRSDLFGYRSPANNTPSIAQVQFLIASHHVRPELAAMLAALVFGGGAGHG